LIAVVHDYYLERCVLHRRNLPRYVTLVLLLLFWNVRSFWLQIESWCYVVFVGFFLSQAHSTPTRRDLLPSVLWCCWLHLLDGIYPVWKKIRHRLSFKPVSLGTSEATGYHC